MLEVDIVNHGYQGKTILKNIKHTFCGNRIHGIIGPNGSGKSTLLKLLTVMEKPVDGKVMFHGKNLHEPNPKIACCWQKPFLFRGTVRYNLEYPMKVRGWAKSKIQERINELTHSYQIEHLLDRNVKGLSGGENARVAIARAVATHPEVLILDEPSAAMDPKNVMFVESLLRKLRESTDLMIIMVTHNMFQAKRIADETIYIADGTIVEAGSTEELFANPRNEDTRQFISGEFVF
ncbi:ATP-binding cassette domain-containing protein [Desulfuribacillus alkaliarsenatis]|uniref:ABC transporter domain-containing protein n=1 Tax=Desulfuribacillus alkaliarsenatis TaxID=766136 RepID=A0A1E5FZ86_9FIRM|nr:ATP-binding cassette domain-containing protein [Desulfuribacillus alkaliarsenatis]OEF95896.1 hypothetical protein BHF68_10920 [Desulfuribacillus alkaliarsenatis]